jgi:hypothetical protein
MKFIRVIVCSVLCSSTFFSYSMNDNRKIDRELTEDAQHELNRSLYFAAEKGDLVYDSMGKNALWFTLEGSMYVCTII